MRRQRCVAGGRNALQAPPERAAGPEGRRWAFRGPLAVSRPSGHEAKPATGEALGSCAGSPPAAGSGMETGLWRTGLADAGRAVNVRAMPHSQRKTVVRAGTRKSGDAGLPLSGRPCGTGSLSVGCGHHPAKFGPRAWVRHRFIVFPEANPACGPPDPMLPSPHGGLIHPGFLAWAGGIGERLGRATGRRRLSVNVEHSVAEIRSFMNTSASLCSSKGETP